MGPPPPHDTRHAMGRHLIEKTDNIAAVQRQFGYTNTAYSIQYARVTDQELAEALDDR
jgi:site-specific recombinase XerC